MVWIIKIKPIDRGWFINKKIMENKKFNKIIKIMISESSLIKILILEIKDKMVYFFSEVLKE